MGFGVVQFLDGCWVIGFRDFPGVTCGVKLVYRWLGCRCDLVVGCLCWMVVLACAFWLTLLVSGLDVWVGCYGAV